MPEDELARPLTAEEEAAKNVLPRVTPIPGFEHLQSPWDVFTPEERRALFEELERAAHERRVAEFEAGKLRLP